MTPNLFVNASCFSIPNFYSVYYKTVGNYETFFFLPRIALDHLVGRFEARVGDVRDAEALVVGLVRRQHRRVGHQREVNP